VLLTAAVLLGGIWALVSPPALVPTGVDAPAGPLLSDPCGLGIDHLHGLDGNPIVPAVYRIRH
jgi:hypothetical protein